jgi:hypothetical protein
MGVDWTPITRAAILLGAVAVLGLVAWFVGGSDLKAWAPNVTVGAVTIATTITVIDKALRSEARQRLLPRTEAVIDQVAPALRWVMVGIANDYRDTNPSSLPSARDAIELADAWLDAHSAAREKARTLRRLEDLHPLAGFSLDLARRLERVRARDREILPPDLIRAIDDFVEAVRQAVALYEIVDPENRTEARSSLETLLGSVVPATREFAVAFGRYAADAIVFTPSR